MAIVHNAVSHLKIKLIPSTPFFPSLWTYISTTSIPITWAYMIMLVLLLLALFLCFLGVVLGLHCIIQCICNLCWIVNSSNSTGLSSDEVNRIPVLVYSGGGGGSEGGGLGKECCICLMEFSCGDILRVLPLCNHGFHVKCIDTWLFQHDTCPTCRFLICRPKT